MLKYEVDAELTNFVIGKPTPVITLGNCNAAFTQRLRFREEALRNLVTVVSSHDDQAASFC